MSKKWLAELLALVISAGAITPLEAFSPPHLTPGKQIVQEVEKAYIKGEYDPFLTQLHQEYERAGKAGVLRGIFESSKKIAKAPPAANDTITVQRNQKLLEAIEENPTSAIAKKVDAIVFYSLPTEKKQILTELSQMKFHLSETAEGTLESKLSAIETEYYIKSLLLDIASTHKKEESPDLPQKKIVLSLDKLEKMHDSAKEKNDKIWIEKLQLAKDANRLERAVQVDLDTLNKLGQGKLDPQNSVEQKVQQIMMDYLQSMPLSSEVAQK